MSKMKNMKMKKFDCIFELADKMCDDFHHLHEDYNYVLAVGKYDFIKALLEDLIINGVEIDLCVELYDPLMCNYGDEYYLSLTESGVSVEKAKVNDIYLNTGGQQIAYISDECNSKILDSIDECDAVYEVHITEPARGHEEPCEKCECCCEEPKDILHKLYNMSMMDIAELLVSLME